MTPAGTRSTAVLRLVLGLALAGCYQPRFPDDVGGDAAPPPVDLFQNDAGADAGACPTDPSPLSALHVSVRTTAFGGRWRPRNVGAIWIEDSSGAFVKTVELWGKTRARWLVAFQAASDGDVTDAVTGATFTAHETHDVSWNLTDGSGCEVMDGEYQLALELTDRDASGVVRFIPFLKETSMTVMPEDSETFHDIVLALE